MAESPDPALSAAVVPRPAGDPEPSAAERNGNDGPPQEPKGSGDEEATGPIGAPTQKARTVCGICNDAVAKYKCPRCPTAYCSVACSKAHRENHPPEEERKPPVPVAPDAPLPDKKSTHPFSVLDDSKELQRLFARYPMLKAKLERIHDTTLPGEEDDVQKGGLPRKPQPSQTHGRKPAVWTPEVGLRRAQQALRRARTDPGEDGDGVREYCELVVHLLSRAGRTDATEMVRHEVVQEEVKAIEWLMNTEK